MKHCPAYPKAFSQNAYYKKEDIGHCARKLTLTNPSLEDFERNRLTHNYRHILSQTDQILPV